MLFLFPIEELPNLYLQEKHQIPLDAKYQLYTICFCQPVLCFHVVVYLAKLFLPLSMFINVFEMREHAVVFKEFLGNQTPQTGVPTTVAFPVLAP